MYVIYDKGDYRISNKPEEEKKKNSKSNEVHENSFIQNSI